jgi:hypothetical protein
MDEVGIVQEERRDNAVENSSALENAEGITRTSGQNRKKPRRYPTEVPSVLR